MLAFQAVTAPGNGEDFGLLKEKLRAGHPAAIEEFRRHFGPGIRLLLARQASTVCGDEGVTAVFHRVARKIQEGALPGRDGLARLVLQEVQRQARLSPDGPPEGIAQPAQTGALREFLDELPTADREALLGYYNAGRTSRYFAMPPSRGSLSHLRSRARARFRRVRTSVAD